MIGSTIYHKKSVENHKLNSIVNSTMTKNKLLGIFLAVVMVTGSIPLGFSEPILQQWEKTNNINEIQCSNEKHVLVMRDSGKPACVSERNADRLGWEIVETNISKHETEINSEIVTVNSQNNPNTSKSNLDRTGGVTPFTSIQFPDTVNVGEEFEVISSWQYFELNEDDEVDVLYTLHDNWNQNIVPTVIGFGNDHGGGIEFLSSDGYELTTYASGTETIDYVYEKFPRFQNTEVHTDNLIFRIDQVSDFPFDHISVTIDQYEEYIISITDNGDGTFFLSTEPHTVQSLDASLRGYMMSEKETEKYQKVIVEGYRYEPPFVCEEDPDCVESQRQAEAQTTPYPAREHWDSLADFVELENPNDVRAFLRTANMTEAVIDEFLELYPELDTKLKTQSFHPSLSFILPQAFADKHPSKVYVHGKFLILDKDGNNVAPTGAMACAVDETRKATTSTPARYTKLQYQGADACKTLGSSGSFGFFTDNKDSNRSVVPADLGVALYLDSEVVEVTDQSNNGAYSSPSRFFNDYSSSGFLGFGTTTINSGEIIKAFTLYQYVTDANKFVEDKFRKNIDKVILRWQDTGNSRINFVVTNYDDNVMQIGFNLVPYLYPTQHEYAHHFMNSIYKSNGGVMLDVPSSCYDHRLNLPETSSVCVWEEGFAAFFPFMVNEVGQLNREIYVNNNNVDTIRVYDIENRKITFSDGSSDVNFSSGLNVEGNVASALYDIVDEIGEANTGGDSKKYDDLDLLYSQFFKAFDTVPSTTDRTMPQQNWTEYKKDWDRENKKSLDRVMYLNTLSNSYTPSGVTIPPDTSYNILFTEDFESGNLNKWTNTGTDDEIWNIKRATNGQIQNYPDNNQVANTEDCDNYCYLELKDSIDMTKFKDAKLQLYRFVDSSNDAHSSEGIIIEVSTNGGTSWTNLISWTAPNDDDNKWHGYDEAEQNISLDKYLTSDDFKFRIIAKSSSNNEDNEIDDVRILVKFKSGGGGGTITPTPTDTTPPTITITSPVNGDTINSDTVTVSGTASDSSGISQITITGNGVQKVLKDTSSFSYTFTGLSAGSHSFTVFAFDNNNNHTTKSVTVTIAPIPQTPPTLSAINDVTVNEGQTKTFSVSASDRNGDTIRYSLSSAPSWVTISGSIVTINAPDELSRSSYSVTVKATDNDGYDSESFRIYINEVNQAPTLSSIGNKSIKETSTLSFTISASDSDRPANNLRYSISNAPTGATINSSTGLFTWTPSTSQSGTYSVTFKVTDNGSPTKSDSQTVTITVINKPAPIPQSPPTLSAINDVTINEGATKTFSVSASDRNGDTISYSLISSPSWVTISGITVTINAPGELSSSSYSGTVQATDNDGTDSESFTINITEINEPPIINNISNQNTMVGDTISFTITASDSDRPSQNLSFSMAGAPTGAVMDSITGEFSWTPSTSQVGTHSVTFTVTDDGTPAKFDSQSVTFTITEIPDNDPPEITAPSDKTYEATDINTILSESQIGIATATDDVDNSPIITNDKPASFKIGDTTITYTATDNSNNYSTDTQIITIIDTTLPTITAPRNITQGDDLDVVLGEPTVHDIFPVTITNNSTGIFPVGTTIVRYTATDDNNNEAFSDQRVTILDKTPPTVTISPEYASVITSNTITITVHAEDPSGIKQIIIWDAIERQHHFFDTTDASYTFTGLESGVKEVTIFVIDKNNNIKTIHTYFVVELPSGVTPLDDTPPEITAPDNKTFEATAVNTILSDSQIGTASATDDVDSNPTITSDKPDSFPLGNTIITYTATDDSNNPSTATQIITIQDMTEPTITAPSNITQGEKLDVILGEPTVYDIFPVTITNNSTGIFPVGTTIVRYTAIDDNENSAFSDQRVTITIFSIPNDNNRAPILDTILPQTIILGTDFSFTVNATDPDVPENPILSYFIQRS